LPSQTLADARQVIEKRLTELRAETKELEDALKHLGSRSASRARAASKRARSSSGRRRGKTANRAPRGRRQEELLKAIKAKPGATASELADKIGVARPQAYSLVRRLREQGRIKKQGKGYAAKG
jgi:sugar-specific transcriptional regulator TrmB